MAFADIDAVFVSGGQVTSITGTIRCDAGDPYLLRVNVRDRDGSEAIGNASGTCTGSHQQWTTSEVRTFGSFACGTLVAGHLQVRSGGDEESFSDRAPVVCP